MPCGGQFFRDILIMYAEIEQGEHKMKRFIEKTTVFILILTFALTSVTSAAFAAEGPAVTGDAAIIYCETTKEVIWEMNADEDRNPASMTKLLTCLLAIENLDLDQVVEVTQEATECIPTKMWLQVGEKITVRDLLHAALLQSANDAAMALGIATAGSIEDFAKMMNERAAKIGCKNTYFVNPSGLYGEGQHSCARDIALISIEAFNNKTLKKIAGTLEYTIEATNKYPERKLENGNKLLAGGEVELYTGNITVKKYDGVFGGKTGTTEEAVATMTVGFQYEGLELYHVIMGTTMEERYPDMRKLLNYTKENVTPYLAVKKGDLFEETSLTYGATNRIAGYANADGYINLPEGASPSLVTLKAVYQEDLRAPITEGDKIGKVEIYLADEKIREISLRAAETIEEGWFLSKYGITNRQTIIICSAAGAVLLLIIVILIIRAVNKKKRERRRRERIMEAARRELEREESMKQRGWPY